MSRKTSRDLSSTHASEERASIGKQVLWPLALAGLGAWLAVRAARSLNAYDLRGKTVLVTGGSRGLGLVLARELARAGAHIAICARDPDELDRAFHELKEQARAVLTVPCDLTDQNQVNEMVRIIQERWGRIDVLINNAGTISVGPMETMTLEDYQQALQTNFWGPLYTTLAVLPDMRRRRQGRIVNVASIGGKVSMPHLLPYDVSKFALVGLSEGLRAELAKDGIVVTTVNPGLMRTGSPRNAHFKGQHEAEYTWFSISDNLPLVSMSAERAAQQILSACKRGDAEVVLSWPALLLEKFHALLPGLTADILGLINQLLPGPGGIGTQSAKGKDSATTLAPSWLTEWGDQAARRNNQIPPAERPGNGHSSRFTW